MKKLLLLGFVFILFSGCRKFKEYFPWHPDPNPDTVSCMVGGWLQSEGDRFEPPISLSISYDENENPILVRSTDYPANPGATSDSFAYDALDRLIFYHRGPMPEFHRYAYAGNSMTPVRDTFTDFLERTTVSTLVQDNNGRIIEEHISELDGTPIRSGIYHYDNDGNLQVTGGQTIEYLTTKRSIFSLHPTWQLIHRNYSKNPSKRALTFNQQGLPLTYGGMTNENRDADTFYGGGTPFPIGYGCQ